MEEVAFKIIYSALPNETFSKEAKSLLVRCSEEFGGGHAYLRARCSNRRRKQSRRILINFILRLFLRMQNSKGDGKVNNAALKISVCSRIVCTMSAVLHVRCRGLRVIRQGRFKSYGK